MLMTTLYNLELGQLPLSRVVPSPSSQQPLTQTHVYQKKKKSTGLEGGGSFACKNYTAELH